MVVSVRTGKLLVLSGYSKADPGLTPCKLALQGEAGRLGDAERLRYAPVAGP